MGYKERGKYYSDFDLGEKIFTAQRTVTEADVVNFAGVSGDYNPLHTNEELMKNSPFKTRIAHGVLTLAIATGLINQAGIFEGTTIAVLEMVTKYTGAVKFGDTIYATLEVEDKKEKRKPEKGIIKFKINVLNQRDEKVLDGTWTIMLKDK